MDTDINPSSAPVQDTGDILLIDISVGLGCTTVNDAVTGQSELPCGNTLTV